MDEATSAVGNDAVEDLYAAAHAAGIALLSFGQLGDLVLRRRHHLAVTLAGNGSGKWGSASLSSQEESQPPPTMRPE